VTYKYWGCVYNPETSNTTGHGSPPCSGEMAAYVNPTVLELQERRAVMWCCDGHAEWRAVDDEALERFA